jgi:hypothetical protein
MQPDGRRREGRKHDRHGVSPNVLPPWVPYIRIDDQCNMD